MGGPPCCRACFAAVPEMRRLRQPASRRPCCQRRARLRAEGTKRAGGTRGGGRQRNAVWGRARLAWRSAPSHDIVVAQGQARGAGACIRAALCPVSGDSPPRRACHVAGSMLSQDRGCPTMVRGPFSECWGTPWWRCVMTSRRPREGNRVSVALDEGGRTCRRAGCQERAHLAARRASATVTPRGLHQRRGGQHAAPLNRGERGSKRRTRAPTRRISPIRVRSGREERGHISLAISSSRLKYTYHLGNSQGGIP